MFYFNYKPFERLATQRLEIFNELSILSINYHLFLLTDFNADFDLQYNVGWSILLVTAINIVVNMSYIIIISTILVCNTLKKVV